MWVGLSSTRVTELWMPPRVPVIPEPGMLMMRSWAWYIIDMPDITRWLTTAPAVIAPLTLNSSIQSLSTMPAARASYSLIHTIGPPHDTAQRTGVGGGKEGSGREG